MPKKRSSFKADDAASTSQSRSARPPQAPPASPEASNQGRQNQQAPGDAVALGTQSESMGSEPSDEDIRLRAYQVYLGRGGEDGLDFDDWLQAEEELRRKE